MNRVYHVRPDGVVDCENTPRGMLLGLLCTIPGFVDHGDGTWSITPPHTRRVKHRIGKHISIANKRRWALAGR